MEALATLLIIAGSLGAIGQEVLETGPHYRVIRSVIELPGGKGLATNSVVEISVANLAMPLASSTLLARVGFKQGW